MSSPYSLLSDTTRFSVDLSTQLKEEISEYTHCASNEKKVLLFIKTQPPILGINSEHLQDVLLYSEFVGSLRYSSYQVLESWPMDVNLSDIG